MLQSQCKHNTHTHTHTTIFSFEYGITSHDDNVAIINPRRVLQSLFKLSSEQSVHCMFLFLCYLCTQDGTDCITEQHKVTSNAVKRKDDPQVKSAAAISVQINACLCRRQDSEIKTVIFNIRHRSHKPSLCLFQRYTYIKMNHLFFIRLKQPVLSFTWQVLLLACQYYLLLLSVWNEGMMDGFPHFLHNQLFLSTTVMIFP